jgi:hypothetical protein
VRFCRGGAAPQRWCRDGGAVVVVVVQRQCRGANAAEVQRCMESR